MSDKKAGKSSPILSLSLIRQRMKSHLEILHEISGLNEKVESVEDLLTQAISILDSGWFSSQNISANIVFEDQKFMASSFSETNWELHSKAEVSPEVYIHFTLAHQTSKSYTENKPFLEEDQRLLDSLTTALASKIQSLRTQQELNENQKLVDKAYQLARIGTWEFDMINQKLHWSPLTKEVHGFDEDHVPDVDQTVNLFKEGYDRKIFAKAAYDAIEKEIPFDVELKIISGKGDERWMRATGEPEYKDGKCIRFYGISQNVTNRKQAEEHVRLSEQRFRSLVQEGSDIIGILDEDANFTYVSPTIKSVLGYMSSDLVGKNAFDFIHPEDSERLQEVLSSITSKKERIEIDPFRFRNKDGQWRWLETTVTDMRNDPAVGGLVANSRDVTDRKNQRQQLIESLAEKEALLAEIHHRVKNNLAVVVGLLQLQGTEDDGEEAVRLQDCVSRVQTMSQIHEQLYQSNNFSNLDFTENIHRLMKNIFKTFKSELNLEIDSNIQSTHLSINQAIPCSLIINEVLTNIMKHAFVGKSNGTISVNLSETRKNIIRIEIGDNGVGFPKDFIIEESDSLGMTLIGVISNQLNATYKFDSSDEGTTFMLEFEKSIPEHEKFSKSN
ncbi:MAG: PAS domain S-box protein [Balneolaceae bacterium]